MSNAFCIETIVLYVNPLQQGLKLLVTLITNTLYASCSLCESITTRIETLLRFAEHLTLLYVLYVNPLQQGLKPNGIKNDMYDWFFVLYVNPLQQGLKHIIKNNFCDFHSGSLCESITTRIETSLILP